MIRNIKSDEMPIPVLEQDSTHEHIIKALLKGHRRYDKDGSIYTLRHADTFESAIAITDAIKRDGDKATIYGSWRWSGFYIVEERVAN